MLRPSTGCCFWNSLRVSRCRGQSSQKGCVPAGRSAPPGVRGRVGGAPAPSAVSPQACTLLLLVLFVYDVFFVFITPFLTKSGNSIMVEVATGPTDSATREKVRRGRAAEGPGLGGWAAAASSPPSCPWS